MTLKKDVNMFKYIPKKMIHKEYKQNNIYKYNNGQIYRPRG